MSAGLGWLVGLAKVNTGIFGQMVSIYTPIDTHTF